MNRLKRLIDNIGILSFLFMIPVSFGVINDYIDRPVADALGSGVILLAFRLLETAAALAIMLGLFVLMNKLSRNIVRQFTVRTFAFSILSMTAAAGVIWYFTFGTANYWIYSECMDVPTHRHCWKSFCDDNDCSGYDRDNPPPSARWIP